MSKAKALLPVGEARLEGHYYPSIDRYGVTLPKEGVVDFYSENWNYMTSTGLSAFLKTLLIPESYFKRLTPPTKIACLAEAQADLKNDLALLVKGTSVDYAAPMLYDPEVYAIDPVDFLQLGTVQPDPATGVRQLDCINGSIFMVINTKPQFRDEYVPSVQVRVPVFYTKEFLISAGLYKVVCTNGLLDSVSTREIKLKFSAEPADSGLLDIIGSLVATSKHRWDGYKALFDRLRDKELSAQGFQALLEYPAFQRELGKAPIREAKKHVSLLLASAEVPWGSPTAIHDAYDAMDTLTYYAARTGENTLIRQKMERSIFNYFARSYGYEPTSAPATK